ncbi:hypothetical protein ZWY2020_027816 [Hordeum vulgare]|nr:hypothetical protein ZWY2020_027816 [Hordeum vulgare]
MMLAADVHLGTKNCDFQMERYVYKRRTDGIYIINLGKTWEKLQMAQGHTPGTFTNQMQTSFSEPRLLILTDPRTDHQPIKESALGNIPTIAFMHNRSPMLHAVPFSQDTSGKSWLICSSTGTRRKLRSLRKMRLWVPLSTLQLQSTLPQQEIPGVLNGQELQLQLLLLKPAGAEWTGAPAPAADGWDAVPAPAPTGWEQGSAPAPAAAPAATPNWE